MKLQSVTKKRGQRWMLLFLLCAALIVATPANLSHAAGKTTAGETAPSGEDTGAPAILPKFEALYQQNPDLVGWLAIPGTTIDFPVMQRDNSYYLKHNFEGKKDKYGELFIDQVNTISPQSTNLMIYGHNMKNRKMFGALMDYKKESFYKEHPVIRFDTLYGEGSYEIIAVILSKIYDNTDPAFKYYQFFQANTPEEFQYYIDNVKALSLYEIPATAQYGDQLITLSTCEYSTKNGRMAIVARKIAPQN